MRERRKKEVLVSQKSERASERGASKLMGALAIDATLRATCGNAESTSDCHRRTVPMPWVIARASLGLGGAAPEREEAVCVCVAEMLFFKKQASLAML